MIFDSYPPWNWKRLNMALKLWLSAGAFVVLTTHLVCITWSRTLKYKTIILQFCSQETDRPPIQVRWHTPPTLGLVPVWDSDQCWLEVTQRPLDFEPSTLISWPRWFYDQIGHLGHFLLFLCFARVQNCETYPPARGKNKQALKKTKLSLHVVWMHQHSN
jgi:hypothetical protein